MLVALPESLPWLSATCTVATTTRPASSFELPFATTPGGYFCRDVGLEPAGRGGGAVVPSLLIPMLSTPLAALDIEALLLLGAAGEASPVAEPSVSLLANLLLAPESCPMGTRGLDPVLPATTAERDCSLPASTSLAGAALVGSTRMASLSLLLLAAADAPTLDRSVAHTAKALDASPCVAPSCPACACPPDPGSSDLLAGIRLCCLTSALADDPPRLCIRPAGSLSLCCRGTLPDRPADSKPATDGDRPTVLGPGGWC